jgi:EipB-like
MTRFSTGSVAFILSLLSTAATAAPDSIVLAPHRAVYDIVLDQTRAAGSVTDLTGRMVYELTGNACDGYTQNMRFVTRTTGQEGSQKLNDLRSSSFEDGAFKTLKFSSSQYADEQQSEQTGGDAARNGEGGKVKVEVTRPAKRTLTLDAATLFPIQHSIQVLEAAKAGKSLYTSDLYDGSEKGEKVYATTAVIGNKAGPAQIAKLPKIANTEKLEKMAAWPVSLSYFEKGKDKTDATPAYELAFLFFENGVSRRLFIDYGEFAVRGNLRELTFLDVLPCDKNSSGAVPQPGKKAGSTY